MKVNYLSSVLFVKDIQVSRRFYEGLLNQRVELDHGLCVNLGGFSLWQRDHAFSVIHGEQKRDHAFGHQEQFELYFESPVLEEVFQSLKEAGVSFVNEIYEQPWGQRALRFYDPDSYVVEIGEPMDVVIERLLKTGLTPSEVAQKTAMPTDIVDRVNAGIRTAG